MRYWGARVSGSWVLAWVGAVLGASSARAEEGYRPPPAGTITPYTIDGSFAQARGEQKFSAPFKGKLEVIAFGDEKAPRYALILTEGRVSPFGGGGGVSFLRIRDGEVVADAGSRPDPESMGNQSIQALLFPSRLAAGDLADKRRDVPVVTLFSPVPTPLACDVEVETKDNTIRVTRTKVKDDAAATKPAAPGLQALFLGQKPRDWREEFVLDKKDGHLREARVSSEQQISAGKDTVVLTVKITAKAGEPRQLSAEQAAAVATDGERLQALARRPASGIAEGLARLLGGDQDGLSPQKRLLADMKKQAADLEKFAEERKDSPLAAAVPAIREKLKSLQQQIEAEIKDAEAIAQMKGKPAPYFTLKNLDDKEISLAEFIEGKVALVSFWGVACGPCRAEAPHLTALYEKYKDDGFVVLAVNGYDEPKEVVSKFMKDEGLTHPVVLMGGTVAREQYHVRGFPTIYWVDHHGNVLDRDVGFGPGKEKLLMKQIEKLLAARNGKPPADKPYKLPVPLDQTKASDEGSEGKEKSAPKGSP